MLKPVANIADGEESPRSAPRFIEASTADEPPKSRKTRRTSRPALQASKKAAGEVELNIDTATWGMPLQEWSQAEKAVWLLYVSAQCGGPKEMTAGELSRVFNKWFRAAKVIQAFNVSRDLAKLKSGAEALVGQEPNQAWFLTDKGNRHATKLVNDARAKLDGG